MFRFRLPWMMSAPAPPPAVTPSPPRAVAPSTTSQPQTRVEPNVNPTTPARRPFRLSGMAPAPPPPPPIQPIVESQSRSEPITITSTPQTLPQASPIWSPKISARQDPRPLAEVPPETKSQSENSFQAALPPPLSPQLSVVSRPPSPRQLPSQLPSPKSSPQPSSPGPISSKSRDASRPSSPVHAQQPHSPRQFQSSGRKSPVTSSPSLTAPIVQQTEGTATKSPPRAESPNIEPNINPTTPVRRPFRLPGIAPAQPPPSIQPTVQRESQTEPLAVPSGPAFPLQAPPLWSPKTSAVVDSDPIPQPEVSVETKSQSQDPSKPALPSETHSQTTSQHPSPSSSPTSAQPGATPQLPSQLSATPQPPSPWRILSKERDTSQLPSSKSSPQPSSPNRQQFQKSSQAETVQQPRSPSQLDFLPPKKTSPITSSPSLTATDAQQTERTTRLPSPPMMSTHLKSPQPSATSDKPLSPVSVKPHVAVSPPQSPEDQSKTKLTSTVTFKSPTKVAKSPKGDIEMVENTSLVAQEPKERPKTVHFPGASGLSPNSKEKLKVSSQTEQKQLKDQHMVSGKEAKIPKATSFEEKQTYTMPSQQTDIKSTVSESRKKPVISNKDQIPFQNSLRNDISMFAQKMAMAHTENSKVEQLASVVALVGKNKGASMKLGFESPKDEGSLKTEPVDGTKEKERNKRAKRKRSSNENDQENQITKAFINNNVQDINNSILMNSFITERNPGVHVTLIYDPTEPILLYDGKGSSEARKDTI
ncbi:hypothetical protein DCAR_0522352 [Daucus carota subsp. sativus]|uniref:Uncharacterized protein n=2 Tax=Daucus carota subsp. sativus TaxID=79200 RepID=A0AAF1B3T6_DAUCS|nr:hypothetical protein DCAR_0522352 [Daucus carota subsp. sativus]